MIHLAARHIVNELNDYLNVRAPALTAERILLANLVEQDGSVNPSVTDRLVLSLVNLEEERIFRSPERIQRREDGRFHSIQPKAQLYMYLLFIANLEEYFESLKALSNIISFFQVKSHFDYSEIPDVVEQSGRLVFDLYSLSFEQQNHLWGALGIKYRPSVLYKVRLVDVQDEQPEGEVPPVREVHLTS